MKRAILQFLFLFLIMGANGFSQNIVSFKALPVTESTFKVNDTLTLPFEFTISSGWHVWGDSLTDKFLIPTKLQFLDLQNGELISTAFSAPVKKSLMGLSENLFEGTVTVTSKVRVVGEGPVKGTALLRFQGCNDKTCLPPAEQSVVVEVLPQQAADDSIQGKLSRMGLLTALFFLFMSGLGLALTPCVYPVIPVTLSYFAGQAGSSRGKTVFLALFYVLGIALTYSLLGTLAAVSGSIMGTALQQPLVLIGVGLIFVALSLSMFGLYDIQPPAFLMQLGVGRKGHFGALLMGLVVGIVAAPCVGPVTAGLLLLVAEKHDPLLGFLYFFVLSLGIGTPFFVLALFSSSLKKLPGSGGWLLWVKKLFGFILLFMAVYYLLPLIGGQWMNGLFMALSISGAIYLGVIDKSAGDRFPKFRTFQRLFAICAIVVSFFIWGAPLSHKKTTVQPLASPLTLEFLETAKRSGKPFVLDFRASWCEPCRAFEEQVLSDSLVQAELKIVPLHSVDLSNSDDPLARKLISEFKIPGVPTFIFFRADGVEQFRHSGFMNKEEFLNQVQKLKGEKP